jgi:hypothetical protein
MSAIDDREIRTSVDEIIQAHEAHEAQTRSARLRGWLLGSGMAVMVAAAAVAISLVGAN